MHQRFGYSAACMCLYRGCSLKAIGDRGSPLTDLFLHLVQMRLFAQTHHHLAAMENFFSYFTVGNVAFVLYSGGYTYKDSEPLFKEVRSSFPLYF